MLKEEVLLALERQRGALVTGGELARLFGVSRTAVWKAVRALREDGNDIASVANSGYKLADTNDTLSESLIREKLKTAFVGRAMALLPTVHSTNRALREADTESTPDGFVVIADGQTHGRGRKNRVFLSPKGEGVYLSVLLKPSGPPHDLRLLTLCAAVAVAEAVECLCGAKAGIKWVNDVFVGSRKIAGILTEAVLSGELQALHTVTVGIGVNTGEVPAELRGIATSVREATGVRGIRNALTAEILNRFEAAYLDFTGCGGKERLLGAYRSRLLAVGRSITVLGAGEPYSAVALGVDDTGALRVRRANGTVELLSTGEITTYGGTEDEKAT